jgi:hypothetical protein
MSENEPVPRRPARSHDPTTQRLRVSTRSGRAGSAALVAGDPDRVPVLLILLVLLAPTLLNLAPVRATLMPTHQLDDRPQRQAARSTTGSSAWFGGQRIEGVTLYDDQNAAVAHPDVRTDLSLWSAIRGNLNVGNTVVDRRLFDARIDPKSGQVNLLHILVPTRRQTLPRRRSESCATRDDPLPIDVNKLKGTVTVNLVGTVSSTDPTDKTIPFTKLEKGQIVLDLNDLEKHGQGRR